MRTILYSLLVFVLYSPSSWAAGYKSAQQWYEGLSSSGDLSQILGPYQGTFDTVMTIVGKLNAFLAQKGRR